MTCLGVDGQVAAGGGEVEMSEELLGDVHREAVDGVGGEEPSEVVRGEPDRSADDVGEVGVVSAPDQKVADHRRVHHGGLAAGATLEQVWLGWQPATFGSVVAAYGTTPSRLETRMMMRARTLAGSGDAGRMIASCTLTVLYSIRTRVSSASSTTGSSMVSRWALLRL